MKRIPGVVLAIFGTGAACVAATASADNLLGFYLGAGVGESTVRSDRNGGDYYGGGGYYGDDGYGHDHHTAWKAIAGIRPLPFVGAELEYIDFGHPGGDGNFDDDYYYGNGADSHPKAGVAFLMGYLPIPVPFLDIYGKAGVARLQTNVETYGGQGACPGSSGTSAATCPTSYRQSQSETKVAYGAGVSSRFWGLTVRGEYERIDSRYGDPDVLSVSATWTF